MPKHIYVRITLPDDHFLANEEGVTDNLVLLAGNPDAYELRQSGFIKIVPFDGDENDCHLFVTVKPMEEPLLFHDREKATPEQIQQARDEHGMGSDDEIEIDDDAWVSHADTGFWVSAWVWLPYVTCTDCHEPVAPGDEGNVVGDESTTYCEDCAADRCSKCGKDNTGGEGYDGLCGDCADKQESTVAR